MKYILKYEVVVLGGDANIVTILGPEHLSGLDLNATHQFLCLPVIEGKTRGAGPTTQ